MSDSKTIVVDQDEFMVLSLKAERYDRGELPATSHMVAVERSTLMELRSKAAQHEENRLGGRTMRDLNAAYRVGWIAGFGLAAAKQVEDTGEGTPMCDVHTAWTNYVPKWVDDAELGEHWKQGFDSGMAGGINGSYVVAKLHAVEAAKAARAAADPAGD